MADDAPGRIEATAAAVAGAAFAIGAILVRTQTPVPAGMFDGAALACVAWGISPAAQRLFGRAGATLARSIGLGAGSLFALATFAPPFDRAALPLALWCMGAGLAQAATYARRLGPAFAGGSLALLALGAAFAWTGASAWPEPGRLRGAMLSAGALALAGFVLRFLLARRAPKLAPSPVGIFLVAALAASYFAYRSLVATRVSNLPLYEWTLGVGAAALLLGRLRRSARDASVPEAWSGTARRHEQDAAPAYDSRMPPLAVAIERYLERGEGFEEYRAALLRAVPHSPPPFRKALQGARPVQGRGRASKAARRERLATHDALMELTHGQPEPPLRAHP